jgi:hypothetical protein
MTFVVSAIGTKRTWASALPMSAFGGKADITKSDPLLLPINIRAEWGQRVQVCCRMIADEVDGPRTDEHDRSDHRDDGGADHSVAPFISAGISPGAAIK